MQSDDVITRAAISLIGVLVYPARFVPRTDWENIDEHWLAVEVLSRSSRIFDREFKRDAYFALGVRQLWLVDWRSGAIEVCTAAGRSRQVRDVVRWRVPGDHITVTIDVSWIFAGI